MRRVPSRIHGWITLTVLLIAGVWTFVSFGLEDSGTPLELEFTSAVGLRPGAVVRFSGVLSGTVQSIEHTRSPHCPDGNGQTAVIVHILVDDIRFQTLHRDAQFWLTTPGPLGELYVEVDPGHPESEFVKDNARLCGMPPLNTEEYGARAEQALQEFITIRTESGVRLDDLLQSTRKASQHASDIGQIFEERSPRIAEGSARFGARVSSLKSHPVFNGSLLEEQALLSAEIEQLQQKVKSASTRVQRKLKAVERDVDGVQENLAGFVPTLLPAIAGIRGMASRLSRDLEAIQKSSKDPRSSLGALSRDLEMSNIIKGMKRALERNVLQFVVPGRNSSPISPAH